MNSNCTSAPYASCTCFTCRWLIVCHFCWPESAHNKVDTKCKCKRCILFFLPVHRVLNAMHILKSRILRHSTPSQSTLTAPSLYNQWNHSASASFHPLFILFHPSYTFLATRQIYSCRRQSLLSSLTSLLHSRKMFAVTEHLLTGIYTHRSTHTNMLNWIG